MEICTCHYQYDIEWLKKSSWPVTVVHKEGGDEFDRDHFVNNWTIPNVGLEVTSYLDFIIKRWDSLPDRVVFLHGHEDSYHQRAGRPLLELIRDANPKYPYVSLNNSWRCVNSELQMSGISDSLAKFGITELPMRFITDSSAQFIVSREAIQRHPKEVYEALYKVPQDRTDATSVEMCMWTKMFTGDFTFLPRPDHFEPMIPEIFYSSACSIPMFLSDFKVAYVGQATLKGPPLIYIKTKEEYEYHKIRATVMFIFDGDQIAFECDDPGKIAVVTNETIGPIMHSIMYEAQEFDKVYKHYVVK